MPPTHGDIGKAMPPTLEVFKGDIKRAHFQACMESYATDSGGIQERHKEGSLSGMHRESYATDSGGVGDIKRAHFQACIGKLCH